MFTLAKNSLAFEIKDRVYGSQDKGISPKGATDQLSFKTAKVLLGEPEAFICYEIIFSTGITFEQACVFTLTGAHYQEMFLHSKEETSSLKHATVYRAQKGDFISLHQLSKGFRLYLMASSSPKSFKAEGLQRGEFSKYFSKSPSHIRLIKGPEFHYLKEPDNFFQNTFVISRDSNLIGLKLISESIPATHFDIISSFVNDGTIQLSKDGPIVLLRHRQTTGGYPRIFSVIAADLDTLAQYPLETHIHFKLIDISEAKTLLLQKEKEFHNFRNAFLDL